MTSDPATVFVTAEILLALVAATGIVAVTKALRRYGNRTLGRAAVLTLVVWALIGPPVLSLSDKAYRSHLPLAKQLQHGAIYENGPIWEYYLLNGALVAVLLWLLVFVAKKHAT
jgi:hypothetical protein